MTSYTFKMEVVTPLFLSGADQNQAELRAPSIKGVLRFWFRAMMGGIVATENTEDLYNRESALFGSTASASRVAIIIPGYDALNTTGWDDLIRNLRWPDSLGAYREGNWTHLKDSITWGSRSRPHEIGVLGLDITNRWSNDSGCSPKWISRIFRTDLIN